ncbi:MAG: YdcF family protein [Bacteriovoracaceae bacterium]|nr:YdcF family protein [Bacteriovoracaceae bacterium]
MQMFKSKYIFETKQTKITRYLKNLSVIFSVFLFLYVILCLVLIRVSDNEKKTAEKALFNNPPELIVVFTGDIGRIGYALKKADEYKQNHIFITGVYSKNTVESILKNFRESQMLDANMLEIDYLASNTVENVISTLQYLRKNTTLKRVLVISSDYHIMRIRLCINTIRTVTNTNHFYYHGIESDYSNPRNIKILIKEVYKLLRTYIFLMLWGVE